MSILITSNGSPTNNGYLHLTTDTRTVAELSSGPVNTTVLHTDGSNMLEATNTYSFSLANGADVSLGNTHLTGSYCRNGRTIPGLTVSLSNYNAGFMLGNGTVAFATNILSFAYLYDPINAQGCSLTGSAVGLLGGTGNGNFLSGNAISCGIGAAFEYDAMGGATVPVVTFNLDNSMAASMWSHRDSLVLTTYVTNSNINNNNGTITVNPVYGYDIEMSNADLKINNTSLFSRKFVSTSNYLATTANCLLANEGDATRKFVIYNTGSTGNATTTISQVKVAGNSITAYDTSSAVVQKFGYLTTITIPVVGLKIDIYGYLRYSRVVYLSVGQSYTLNSGGACFVFPNFSSSDLNSTSLGVSKISTSSGDGNYYLLQLHYITVGGTNYSQTTYIAKSGNTLTLQSNAPSVTCVLIVYDK